MNSVVQFENSLKRMEKEAQIAKSKGMNSRYSMLVAEISEMKRKLSQMKMGAQGVKRPHQRF